MRQSPWSASLPTFPSASAHLRGSVTMSMVQGGFDTADVLVAHCTINPSLAKHIPVSCCAESTLTSLQFPKRICKSLNQHIWEEKLLESQSWLTAKSRRVWKGAWLSLQGINGFYMYISSIFKYIYVIATCSQLYLSPLYLSAFTG